MGVVQRQTFKNNILAYLAVAVGAFAQVKIYPIDYELKGHADGLLKIALLIFPLFTLGTSAVMVRFLPYLKGDKDEVAGQLLTRSIVAVSVGLILLALGNALFIDELVSYLTTAGWQLGKLVDYRWTIFGLVSAMVYASVFTAHLTNFKRIAIPVVFNNLWPKIGLLTIFLLATFGFFNRDGFTIALVVLYLLIGVGLIAYATFLGIFRLRWGRLPLEEKNIRDILSLAVFGVFGSIGSVLATHLDTIFVNTLIDVDAQVRDRLTGVYSFGVFVSAVIAIPYRAVNAIAAPIVAEDWKEGNIQKIGKMYRESAAVLFAVGGYVFSGIIVCVPYLYQLTARPDELNLGYYALVCLGGGQLFDQLTSINGTIISFTDYYRWNIVFIVLLGVVNGLSTYYAVATLDLGLTGAGLATMLSLCLYNVVKGLFIYIKMGIHPLSASLFFTAFTLICIGIIAWYVPGPTGGFLNLIYRGFLITALFLIYLRFTKGVPALRRVLQGGLKELF